MYSSLALSVLALVASAQNLIQNGDFAKNSCRTYCVSNDVSSIAPWKIYSTTNNFEIDNVGTFPEVNTISMDLNSDAPVTLSQSVVTVAGAIYKLSLSLSINGRCGKQTASGYVTVNGVSTSFAGTPATQVISGE